MTQPSLFEKLELPTLRKLPETSIAAFKQAGPEMKAEHYLKIIKALQQLGSANYEVIAEKAGLKPTQVGRRMIDLERDQKVYKPGIQTKTKSGRKAFNYSLTNG